jgi:hypothetical protein
MQSDDDAPVTEALIAEVAALRTEVTLVNKQLYQPRSRVLFQMFLRGIAFGLGSFLGATLVVSILIYSLASIDFIPIVGEWAREIADLIKQP